MMCAQVTGRGALYECHELPQILNFVKTQIQTSINDQNSHIPKIDDIKLDLFDDLNTVRISSTD